MNDGARSLKADSRRGKKALQRNRMDDGACAQVMARTNIKKKNRTFLFLPCRNAWMHVRLQIPSVPWIIWKPLSSIPTTGFHRSPATFSPTAIWYNQIQRSTTTLSSFFASAAGVLLRFHSALKSPKVFHFKRFYSFTYFSVCLFVFSPKIAILWSENLVGIMESIVRLCWSRIRWQVRYIFPLLFLTIICKDLCIMLDD